MGFRFRLGTSGNRCRRLFQAQSRCRTDDDAGRSALTKDGRCSLADAWRSSTIIDGGLALEWIGKTIRVLRSDGNAIEAQTPLGIFGLPAADVVSLTGSIRDCDLSLYGAASAQIRAGDTILDCGASIGTFTRFALNRGAKRVVAIEIAPDTLHCLQWTFAAEIRDRRRVVVFPKGVRNEDAELTLRVSDSLSSLAESVVFQHESAGPKVLLTTIDKITAELSNSTKSTSSSWVSRARSAAGPDAAVGFGVTF